MSSVADAGPSDDDEDSPKRQPDDVPEVVRRSIEGKAARRRLVDVSGTNGRKRRPSAESREDGAENAVSSHCRHCGADLSDLCANCHTKRISLDFEVDEGVIRAVDGKHSRIMEKIRVQ